MTEAQKNFIENIANACIKLYPKYKILPSLAIAQACKESKFGQDKGLGQYHYNFFGMKWTKTCGCDFVEYNTKEFKNGQYVTVKAKFRSYKNFEEGMQGYFDFITGYKRYSNLIGELDSCTACLNVQADGWATAPNYGMSLYKDYVLAYDLIKYDDIVLGRTVAPVTPQVKEEAKIDKPRSYVVKKGDTLWGISKKFLGNGIYWRRIYDANNLKNTIIYVGQILKIPY